MIGTAEALAQRLITSAFINADPVTVILSRKTQTRRPGGGRNDNTSATAPQVGRLIASQDKVTELPSGDGRVDRPTYVLLMAWNANLQDGDQFQIGTDKCLISAVHGNDYEKKGDVVVNG